MDVFAELTTSKDHPVSPSSQDDLDSDGNAVFVTVRDRLDFTISGSRFVIFPLQRSRVSRPSIAHFPGLALARRRREWAGCLQGRAESVGAKSAFERPLLAIAELGALMHLLGRCSTPV